MYGIEGLLLSSYVFYIKVSIYIGYKSGISKVIQWVTKNGPK